MNRRDVLKGGIFSVFGAAFKSVDAATDKNTNEHCPLGLSVVGIGVDHNMIVYDHDAKSDQFTMRLLGLMTTIMNRNKDVIGTSLSRPIINIAHLYFSSKMFLDWVPQDCTMNYQPNILEEFNRLGGTLPNYKTNLVVALGDGGEVLLGAY